MDHDVLIVPDKFKGTLTARAAAELIAQGWREARPEDRLELLPMSDGGDGFGEVLGELLNAEVRMIDTIDASHAPRAAKWWWESHSKTAIVESAQIIGLALLPNGQHHPFELDTFGLGSVLRAATASGASRCLLGIGGSATNDGGFGMARSLGWEFFDRNGSRIERWIRLDSSEHIAPPTRDLSLPNLVVAVDVQNPLLGPTGASRVYGPQKGLRPEDMAQAERCLDRMLEICERDLRLAPSSVPGDGAAGGLGFGLRCFANAKLESGFNLFAETSELERRVSAARLVITGEGAIDRSTLMGKGVGQVADVCRKHRVPCIGVAGTVLDGADGAAMGEKFSRVCGMTPTLTNPDEAKSNPAYWLPRLVAGIAREWPKT